MPRMKRAYRGLYGNRMIQFGNKISFAENKSRRTWKPNVQVKSVYSETLGRMLRFRMTTYVMRCIKKHGGIDEYLIRTKDSEIKYPRALELRQEILEARASQQEDALEVKDPDAALTGQDHTLQSEQTVSGAHEPRKGVATHKGRSAASALRGTSPSQRASTGLLEVLLL